LAIKPAIEVSNSDWHRCWIPGPALRTCRLWGQKRPPEQLPLWVRFTPEGRNGSARL